MLRGCGMMITDALLFVLVVGAVVLALAISRWWPAG
jgi:hypothetical protein